MPNYEDFKKYGEMDKQKKAQPAPEPEKKVSALSKLLGKGKSRDR